MKDEFEVAAGSIVGRDHCGRGNLLFGKNNQDAFCFSQGAISIGIVCDGCSESVHSELGARFGALCILSALAHRQTELLDDRRSVEDVLDLTRKIVLRNIQLMAQEMDMKEAGALPKVIAENFLFTALGVMVAPEFTCIFSVGDGVYFLNGEMNRIGPFPGNMPPYLSYGLVNSSIDPTLLCFTIHSFIPTKDVQTLLIGTDGMMDLHEVADKVIPGRTEQVGPISQFWQEDRFFRGPDQIRRRLALINSEVVKTNPDGKDPIRYPGLLPDDTTCIVFRRKS